jgi:hypothetical protein
MLRAGHPIVDALHVTERALPGTRHGLDRRDRPPPAEARQGMLAHRVLRMVLERKE